MPQFHIFAQKRINSRSAELEKRTVNGTKDQADEEIEALEDDGFEIADVHVYHASIVARQAATPSGRRGGRSYR